MDPNERRIYTNKKSLNRRTAAIEINQSDKLKEELNRPITTAIYYSFNCSNYIYYIYKLLYIIIQTNINNINFYIQLLYITSYLLVSC